MKISFFKRWGLAALLLCCLTAESRTQTTPAGAREAEWQSYALPAIEFARYTADNAVAFRVPITWKQQGTTLAFDHADGSQLRVVVDPIAEGIPLRSYVAAILQSIRKMPGDADGVVVRRTQISGLEAREIMFEMTDALGVTTRRLIWAVVDGPRAVGFILIVPTEHAAQIEPDFKALLESTIISPSLWSFEKSRTDILKASKPGRIDEALRLLPALDGRDETVRAQAIASLAKLFATSPDAVADFLADPRAMVRAAAVEAIGLSGNQSLNAFLVAALNDRDAFVAARAAHALGPVSATLMSDPTGDWMSWSQEQALRAAVSLDAATRIKIAASMFKPTSAPSKVEVKARPAPPAQTASDSPPPPPPPIKGRVPGGVTKRASGGIPKGIPGGVPGGIPGGSSAVQVNARDMRWLAITLLSEVPPADFKMPFDQIVASGNEMNITTAFEVAWERRERLPVDLLFKLLSSGSDKVQRLAAWHLGEGADLTDIARLEARAQQATKDAAAISRAKNQSEAMARGIPLTYLLDSAIKIIRLRAQLAAASPDARKQILKQAMTDREIAYWVWDRFARDEFEGPRRDDAGTRRPGDATTGAQASGQSSAASVEQANGNRVAVAPLGENVFPATVTHYVALPDPAAAIAKLGGALDGLQMESARSQADWVLMTSALKESVAKFLGAPSGGATLDYLGIKLGAPIAMARWKAADAPRAAANAERNLVVLRVSNRDRFERLLALYQSQFGHLENVINYAALGTRFIGFAPAILPLSVQMIFKAGSGPLKATPPAGRTFTFIRRERCLGQPVQVFVRQEVGQDFIRESAIYLAYIGDAALLAPDWYSLRDGLSRLAHGGATLNENADFKRAVASRGDAIYLSNLLELFPPSVEPKADEGVTESGALKLTPGAWENDYHLAFKASAWSRPLVPFHPSELTAPRELLPRSTFAYLFTKLDAKAAWDDWFSTLFSAETQRAFAATWALDVEKEVLPELGPECGVALIGLPGFDMEGLRKSAVFFFKLKSDQLQRALAEGKLFKQTAATTDAARVTFGGSEIFITVKNGFLVIAGDAAALKKLDATEHLEAARDYARAAGRAPDRLIAFGGYNLEAAIAELNTPIDDPTIKQVTSILTSLARAFHSQNFYATATSASVDARMSISLDREGRYSVAELSSLTEDFRLSFAVIEAHGVAIVDQQQIERLKLRLRAKATGEIDRLKEDLALAGQQVEKRSDQELIVSITPRHAASVAKVQLPITGAEFAPYLQPTREIRSDDKTVMQQAREIVGNDRDAWSVARKLAEWTHKNLKWKSIDYADAAQTLATREADCSEFSQLFVAMARAVGLPARIVGGIAYGDGSFGGHAWVEVYAGRWIEMDPTWGTDFVDATHIRSAGGDLLNYAALNLVHIDVLEAPRGVADYQRDATRLAEKLCAEIGQPRPAALASVIDMTALADEHIGAGAWAQMSESERDGWLAAQSKLTAYLSKIFAQLGHEARVLKVTQKGKRAEALLLVEYIYKESLVKLSLARHGEAWTLMDVIYAETEFHLVAEKLRPTVQAMLAQRAGKQPVAARYSEQERVVTLLTAEDAKSALAVVEQALAAQPGSRVFRNLKAFCLVQLEREDEALQLWAELSREENPMAEAVYALASHYEAAEDATHRQRAIELFTRYMTLEPDDPRPHSSLAALYEQMNDTSRAEAEYRAALARDPRSLKRSIDLAVMLAQLKRHDAALAVLDTGAKQSGTSEDLLALLISRLNWSDASDAAETLVAAHPERLAKSAEANLNLAQLRIKAGRTQAALPPLQKAIELQKDYGEAHTTLADAYRTLHNWTAALQAADAAIRIDEEDAAAHYHRACALARLKRASAALAALKQAIELDGELAEAIEEEEDLQSLKALPEFKKLLPKAESDKE